MYCTLGGGGGAVVVMVMVLTTTVEVSVIQMLFARKGKLAAVVNFAVECMGSHLG
jgi:hypothetical protein